MVAVQRAIEAAGIPTVLVTLDTEQSGLMRPPRAIHPVGFEFGHSLGKPDQPDLQKQVIKAALEQLEAKIEPGNIHEKDFPDYSA